MSMMIEENPIRSSDAKFVIDSRPWETLGDNVYECRSVICPEGTGGFSAHALRLPGVVSEGETLEEAIRNITEAFRGAIAAYKELGKAIPWEDVQVDRPNGWTERWILVNV